MKANHSFWIAWDDAFIDIVAASWQFFILSL